MLDFIRALNQLLVRIFYRIRLNGLENIPQAGGALLVANHVSFTDPPLLAAIAKRPVRFLMYRSYYEAPLLNFIARHTGAIPVSHRDGPKELIRSLATAKDAIQNGELVCIFAEGELTRLGNLLPFNKGLERIMKGVDAPIVPIHLDAIWGSFFSHRSGKPMRKIPRQIPYPVTITIGKALPGNSTSGEVRSAIQQLASEAFLNRKNSETLLHSSFIRTAKRALFRRCISDSSGKKLTYLRTLSLAAGLARVLKFEISSAHMVGILLPPSIGAVLANIAVLLTGRIPVNLNYTSSSESLTSSIKQCGIQEILSAKEFLEKVSLQPSSRVLELKDLLAMRARNHWFDLLVTCLLPSSRIETWCSEVTHDRNDVATVIFSSGSTGEPKGVMLSHANITANILALGDVFQLQKSDTVVGVLPFFHSFGFTGTLWLPLLSGIGATYHENPLDAQAIGALVQRERGTILMSTPTFLLSYIRKVSAEQFKSLRCVVVGAEKLKERVAKSFYDKFGIAPREGYGATELSPVAMLNVEGFSDAAVTQVGNKAGSVGHPLPGVSAKVVNLETYSNLDPNNDGLLLVRGPNVMLGYLNDPLKTKAVMHEGWYVTGDIARIDEDGFVTITDRLSRFSKIGGEMVPHVKIEEAIQKHVGKDTQCVVTAVPHEKKGEQLVVLYCGPLDAAMVIKSLSEEGFPNLWIPKKENYIAVDHLPILGTGKLNLREIKKMALERSAALPNA